MPDPLSAATYTWIGAGPDSNWSTTSNWTGGVPASSQDTAVIFDGTTNLAPQQNINADFLLNSLTFNATAGTFTLGGGALDFRTNTAGTLPTLTQNAASNETITNNLLFANNLGIGVTGAGTLTLRGTLTSTGGNLTKTGMGNLILNGASDLTGNSTSNFVAVEVNAGTLTVGSGGSLTANNYVTVDGGATLALSGTGSLRIPFTVLDVSGNSTSVGTSAGSAAAFTLNDSASLNAGSMTITYGTATQNGGSAVIVGTLTAGNDASGAYVLNGGTLTTNRVIVGDSVPGFFTQNGGTLTTGVLTLGNSSGMATYTLNGGTTTASGVSNALSKSGRAGTGTFFFNGGTLRPGANNATFLQTLTGGNGGGVTYYVQAGGAKIDTNGFNAGATSALLHDATAGAPATDGGLTKLGAGTLTLSGANTYTGGTFINAGTLQFAKTNAMPAAGAVAVASGATMVINAGGTGEFTNAISGNGSLGGLLSGIGGQGAPVGFATGAALGIDTTNAGGNFTYAGNLGAFNNGVPVAPNLIKLGSGTLTLTGSNSSFSGSVTLAAGTLNLGSSNALTSGVASIIFAGGTLQYSASNNFDFSSRFSQAANQAYSIDTNGQNVFPYASALTSAGGSLTKLGAGTLTLSGTNTFTGPLNIYAGTLAAASEANLGGTSVVTVNGGGTLQITSSATLARTYNLGNATLAASSGQTLTVGGGAIVNGGYLAGPGTVVLGGGSTLTGVGTQVGSTLTQTDGGAATLNNATVRGVLSQTSGTLALNNTMGVTSSRVTVAGTANATGTELDGTTTINGGGALNATGTSLYLGGGSRTTVNSGGTLTAASGTTIELNGGLLTNNGTQTGALNVNYGSTARGTGTYGTVTVGSGGKFGSNAVTTSGSTNGLSNIRLVGGEASSASSKAAMVGPVLNTAPATASVAGLTLSSGSLLAINVQDARGAAGTGYDSVSVLGALTLSGYGTNGNQITVGLSSLNSSGAAGTAANFDPTQSYALTLVTVAGGIQGFDASAFQVDTSSFQNSLNGGHFYVAQSGNSLNLDFAPVPEPGTWLGGALLIGTVGLTLRRRLSTCLR